MYENRDWRRDSWDMDKVIGGGTLEMYSLYWDLAGK